MKQWFGIAIIICSRDSRQTWNCMRCIYAAFWLVALTAAVKCQLPTTRTTEADVSGIYSAVMSPALTAVILGTFTPPAIIGLMTCSQQTQPSSHFSVTDGVETSGSQLAQVQLGLRAAIIARGRARPPESPSRSRQQWIPHNSIIKKNFGSFDIGSN